MRASEYAAIVQRRIGTVAASQGPAIERAAGLVADALAAGGRIWVSQTSHTLHLEATHRAGGLMAAHVLEDVATVTAGDVVIVATPAGTWPYPSAVARGARDRGARVIAISGHTFERDPRIAPGDAAAPRLGDLADVAIDAECPFGDGETSLEDEAVAIIPSSGALSVTVFWMIVAEVVELLHRRGLVPLMWQSNLLEGAIARNEQVERAYRASGIGVRVVADVSGQLPVAGRHFTPQGGAE